MTRFQVPAEVTAAQGRATRPDASAWVSANAGAGKTHVLTERVVRLMAAGARPEAILCLTYTTAAAAEMKERVFRRLSALALAEDGAIDAFLGAPARPAERDAVRRLFARALEAPGGLRIQTIHAFCASLLRQFPLEANVSGRFRVLDDGARDELLADAVETVLAEAARAPVGPVARDLARLLRHLSPAQVPDTLAAAVHHRRPLLELLRRADGPGGVARVLGDALGLAPGETVETIEDEICASERFPPELVDELCGALGNSGPNDRKLKDRFDAFRAAEPGAEADLWLAVFMTVRDGALAPRKTFVTKAIGAAVPWVAEAFAAECERLEALLDRRRAALAAEASAALFSLAERTIAAVEREKGRRGLIDYADQVAHALALLATREAADWVRYKLDQGIDHILVDEAQDTSPDQWRIVGRLAEEFFAGLSAREEPRTLFVVGDGKQSIYSFQGADPEGFDRERRDWRGRAEATGAPFHDVVLGHSFRSTEAVLSAVDVTFARPHLAAALFAGDEGISHHPVRADAPGVVEVWPPMADASADGPDDWTLPLDHDTRQSGAMRLAGRIAATVRDFLDRPLVFPDGEPLTPGEVMVLVRKRAGFADLMNRALKQAGVPVAGADRLDLVADIAVKDLAALARAALTPADDLSLAAVLRSPLVDLPEEALFDLAHGRPGALRAALLARREEVAFAGAAETVERLVRAARGARPFDFYGEVLGPLGGRRRFLERLGPEVAEILDAFLAAALAHEESAVPTLEGFLHRLDRSTTEIKRETGGTADAVRVMTVHGAKGLEARLVFLVDHTGAPVPPGRGDPFFPLPLGGDLSGLVFAPSRDYRPEAITALEAERRAAAVREYRRLLYVGMTRAKDRLVVCGFCGPKGPHPDCWMETVSAALGAGCETVAGPDGEIAAWRWTGSVPDAAPPPAEAPPRPAAPAAPAAPAGNDPLPAFLATPAVRPVSVPRLSAAAGFSGAGEAGTAERGDGLPRPEEAVEAVTRGDLVHRLFEHLVEIAPADRPVAARRLLSVAAPETPPAAREALADEAVAALADPAVAALLSAPGLAERDVVGDVLLPGGRRVRASGRIDRLVVERDRLVVVDFKTDRAAPADADAVPRRYREQLAVYRALLAPLAVDRPVETVLLYTAVPRIVAVPPRLLPDVKAAAGAGASA